MQNLTPRALAFCIVIVAVCYANSVPNEFIFDDVLIVASNPEIRDIAPIRFLLSPFWGKAEGIYRPLTILSFSIDYSIFHRWAPGFRIVNLLLHAINGYLVFLLARAILQASPPAWAAAAAYLAHPVHTESVAAIAGRSQLLAAAFFFFAWLLFRQGRTWWCAAAFLLSLLGKENAIALPAVLLLDMWIFERDFKKAALQWKRFAVLAAVVAAYLGLRASVAGTIGIPRAAQYFAGDWTFLQRELTTGRVFLRYFQLLLAPIDIAGDYDYNSIPLAGVRDWDAWLGILLIAATIVLAVRVAKRYPRIAFAVLFFYVTMLPMSNWIFPTGVTMAERHLYIPSFGIALLAGIGWARLPSIEIRRLAGVGVMIIAALLCISHNYIWRDNFTFYKNMARVVPNNIRGRQGYGIALLEAGRVDEAREQFEAGLRVARNAPLLLGLAGTMVTLDRNCQRAQKVIDEALAMQPHNSNVEWLRAECFDREGQTARAEETYRTAIEDAFSPDARLLFEWGLALQKLDRESEALAAFRRAALIDPNDKAIQRKLAGY